MANLTEQVAQMEKTQTQLEATIKTLQDKLTTTTASHSATQQSMEATLTELQSYIDSITKPLTSIVDTTINREKTGNQQVIFEASSVRYKLDGTAVVVDEPRFETGYFGQGLYIGQGSANIVAAFPDGWSAI